MERTGEGRRPAGEACSGRQWHLLVAAALASEDNGAEPLKYEEAEAALAREDGAYDGACRVDPAPDLALQGILKPRHLGCGGKDG
uniref:Uncharacterized protein n=1 Tax=Oryza punctata TaxID=4537 RepID=A0A0E0MFJ0_ORYPU